MPFSFFDHTGDIGMDIEARTLDGLFADAAAAFVETVAEPAAIQANVQAGLDLASPELDLLLLDWLNELLFRFETDGFLSAHVRAELVQDAAGWRLHAEVEGERGAGTRLPIKVLVKAVTYHALGVWRSGDGWRARVVLDI